MPITSDELVRSFGVAVDSRDAAVFVGAGLSAASGLPDWAGLLADMRTAADVPNSLRDLPLVAQYIVTSTPGGRESLETHILHAISGSGTAPGPGHEILARMPIGEIWTTNYDSLLEHALPDARVICSDGDLLDRRSVATRRVIKMHGSIGDNGWRANPVITRSDYENYQSTHPRMWAALQATYLTRSMLFLGFSFSDPNIDVLLRLSRTLNSSRPGGEHFTVLRRPKDGEDLQLYRHQMHDLESTGVSVCEVDEFSELEPILSQLERRTRIPALFVSGSYEDEEHLKALSRSIGTQLASTPLTLVSLAGQAATDVSFAMGTALTELGKYDAGRLLFFFRPKDTPAPIMQKRLGTAVYEAADQDALRQQVLRRARAALVIHGGDGTRRELALAVKERMPVIPLAFSGGAALEYWSSTTPDRALTNPGTDDLRAWAALNSGPDVSIAAAMRLIQREMFLRTVESNLSGATPRLST